MATDVDGTPANKTRTHAYKPNVPYLRNLDEVTLDYLVSFNKKRSNFAFEQSEMLSVSRSRRGGEAPPLAAHYTTVIINCRVLCVFTKKKKKTPFPFGCGHRQEEPAHSSHASVTACADRRRVVPDGRVWRHHTRGVSRSVTSRNADSLVEGAAPGARDEIRAAMVAP